MGFKLGRVFEVDTVRGQSLEVGEKRIVPVARSVSLAVSRPRQHSLAGFLWVRPVAVEVTDAAGVRRLPIADPGRTFALGLLALVGALAILVRLINGAQRQRSRIKGVRR